MELKSRGLLCTLVLTILLSNHQTYAKYGSSLAGSRQECNLEGQRYKIDMARAKCFECICVHGFVECKQHCPANDGCFEVEKSPDGCCDKCKGCMFKGVKYESYTEWKDPDNPCMVYQCHGGIVTELQVQCHTPCPNPTTPKPGHCCGTCKGCSVDNSVNSYQIMSSDPCLKCTCSANGGMMCTKKACPVLDCPTNNTIYKEGECCPKCVGKTTSSPNFFTRPGICVAFNKVLKEHEGHVQDKCTKCTCKNGTTICSRQTCPVLNCSPRQQRLPKPTSCCKECNDRDAGIVEEFSSKCTYRDEVYESGEEKYIDPCTRCRCNDGQLRCEKEMCPANNECPFGSQKFHKPNECCPRCIEKPATCMVFGDPHYKTFDGRFYTFKGDGKYQLVSDCKEHKFSVRVANAYQNKNSTSTTTKRVSIKVTGMRINLGQKLVTKVNGEKISSFPYKRDKVLIEKLNGTIEVRIKDDVKVLWNGKSLVEVTVPPKFRKNLCGLCGNFNLNSQDDFRDRRGNVFDERSIQKFGASWCVGKNCLKRITQPKTCVRLRKHDKKYCSFFEISTFERCRSISNSKQFLKACMMDMCDCPSGKCYCESLMAYAQECKRLNIDVTGWEQTAGCEGSSPTRLKIHKPKAKKTHPKSIFDELPINIKKNMDIASYSNYLRNQSRIPITSD